MVGRCCIAVFLVLYFAYQVNGAVNCTSSGRYADPSDTTCKNYTLCVLQTTGTFLSYNYVCPTTSLFSPISRLCTTNYVCNTTTSTTTPASSVCTADGFIPDSTSTNCLRYIQCVNINGVFSATTLTCPTGTFFNPTTTLCDANYICTATFTCAASGRYPNSADRTCRTYYLCVVATNGTIAQYQYTCPTTSVFSPISRLCTTTYRCPTS